MGLLGAREVRWEGNGNLESEKYILFYENGTFNHQLGNFILSSFPVHFEVNKLKWTSYTKWQTFNSGTQKFYIGI